MQLRAWRQAEGLTLAGLSDRIGVTPEAAGRYETRRRIPSPAAMRAIYVATGGRVTPNDFYDLPPLEHEAAA